MITEMGGSDDYRNRWVKPFPESLGQTITEMVGQRYPEYSTPVRIENCCLYLIDVILIIVVLPNNNKPFIRLHGYCRINLLSI